MGTHRGGLPDTEPRGLSVEVPDECPSGEDLGFGIRPRVRAAYSAISRYIWHDKCFCSEIELISYFRKVRACRWQTVPSLSVPVSGNEHEDVCHVTNRCISKKRQGKSSQNVCEA
jgi:hypothetical protein